MFPLGQQACVAVFLIEQAHSLRDPLAFGSIWTGALACLRGLPQARAPMLAAPISPMAPRAHI